MRPLNIRSGMNVRGVRVDFKRVSEMMNSWLAGSDTLAATTNVYIGTVEGLEWL